MPETTERTWRPIDPPSDRPATAARPSRCPDDEQVDPDATQATAGPKCRACIEQGIPGECTDRGHQVAPEIGPPRTAVIEDIIRSSAHTLISGRADTVAGTILATLAHRHGLRPGVAAPEPPADLRDAIGCAAGLAIAQCHDDRPLTWHHCGQCQGTPRDVSTVADRVTPERGQRWESRDCVYDAGRQVRLLHRHNHSPMGAWVAEVVAYPRRPHLVGGQTRLSDVTLRKKWKPIDA